MIAITCEYQTPIACNENKLVEDSAIVAFDTIKIGERKNKKTITLSYNLNRIYKDTTIYFYIPILNTLDATINTTKISSSSQALLVSNRAAFEKINSGEIKFIKIALNKFAFYDESLGNQLSINKQIEIVFEKETTKEFLNLNLEVNVIINFK